MSNDAPDTKRGLRARIRKAFRYDTDPKNSSSIMENHIVAIFDGFYTVLILILLVVCAIAFLIWRHHTASH